MKKITFGRSPDNDIVFEDKSVSRHHGYLLVDGSKVCVVDDDSLNGIRVNGKTIKNKALLHSRDKVVIAKKFPLEWQEYADIANDETILSSDKTARFDSSIYESLNLSKSDKQALINIPSKMEINQNHAAVYRNGESGADWKVPMKRNIGEHVGNTLGCVISIIIVIAFIAILVGLGS